MKREVLLVSDGTGITVNSISQSLLSQFDGVDFHISQFPYIDTTEKIIRISEKINDLIQKGNATPIVITTLVEPDFLAILNKTNALIIDVIQTFMKPLERNLGVASSHAMGKAHGMHNHVEYEKRMDAVNFSLHADDGAYAKHYDKADIILIGVSRCGKTPTSLYLALHKHFYVANYPLTEDDLLEKGSLPQALLGHREKLFGLTIDVERLVLIRSERLAANSRYASFVQCDQELKAVQKLYHRYQIPYLNSTNLSVEELATKIASFKENGDL